MVQKLPRFDLTAAPLLVFWSGFGFFNLFGAFVLFWDFGGVGSFLVFYNCYSCFFFFPMALLRTR